MKLSTDKQPITSLFCVALAVAVLASVLVPALDIIPKNGSVRELTEGWSVAAEDGTLQSFTDFGKPLPAGKVTLVHDTDCFAGNSYALGFYNYYAAVTVRLDDSVVYTYGTEEDLKHGVALGNYYSMISLHEGLDNPAMLSITFTSREPMTIYPMNIGSGSALEMAMIREYIPTLIMPIISLLFIIIIAILSRKKTTRDLVGKNHYWLAVFSLLISIWQIADAQLLMDIGLEAGKVCILSFEVYMLLPVALMMFMYHSCREYQNSNLVLCGLSLANFVLLNLLHFLRVSSFLRTLLPTHILVAACLLVSLLQTSGEYGRERTRSSAYLFYGYLVFFTSSVFQFLNFLVMPASGNSGLLQFGSIIFVILQIAGVLGIVSERISRVNEQLTMQNRIMKKTFGRFIPDEIVQNLVNAPEDFNMEGNTRHLTVLQSDIRGFTELVNAMNAHDAIDMLNHYFEAMTIVIQRYGGVIIEFIGDSILAVFDATTLGTEHVNKAIFASISMQNNMEDVNTWNRNQGYPQFEMGIGINTGDTYVGYIGSKERVKYDAIGSTINLVSRIESYSTGGQILISDSSRKECTLNLRIASSFHVYPKGFANAFKVHLIGGIGDPYHIVCPYVQDVPQPLSAPVSVTFHTIRSKHIIGEVYTGSVSAASATGAILKTDCHLQRYDNLRIDAYGGITGKVMSTAKVGFLIRFTSVPADYDAWGILQKESGDSHE